MTYNNLTGTITTNTSGGITFGSCSGITSSGILGIGATGTLTINGNSNYGYYSSGIYNSYKPSKIETIKELREYCESIDEVTEFEYNFIEERIPFNTDLLSILNKAGIRSTYIDILNRSKKIKRVLKNG